MPGKRRQGTLIAVEGGDGSGKGTQTRLLVRRLRLEGAAAVRIAFPQYGRSFFGKTVAAYLRGEFGGSGAVDPHLAAVLYAGDRYEARETMLTALAEGKVVVLDRYVDSNKVHQAANLGRGADCAAFLKWIDTLEYGVFKLPRPDFTLYLRVPTRIAVGLIDGKSARVHLRGKKRDLHEADLGHLRRAERLYVQMARACPPRRGALIECVEKGRLLGRAEIADRIRAALTRRGLLGGLKRGRHAGR